MVTSQHGRKRERLSVALPGLSSLTMQRGLRIVAAPYNSRGFSYKMNRRGKGRGHWAVHCRQREIKGILTLLTLVLGGAHSKVITQKRIWAEGLSAYGWISLV